MPRKPGPRLAVYVDTTPEIERQISALQDAWTSPLGRPSRAEVIRFTIDITYHQEMSKSQPDDPSPPPRTRRGERERPMVSRLDLKIGDRR